MTTSTLSASPHRSTPTLTPATPSPHHLMQAGDLVIIYETPQSIKSIQLRPHSVFQNRFGIFDHNSFINKPYGSKIFNRQKNAYIIALHITPELWSNALLHRTQIMYTIDRSCMILICNIQVGSVVYECGTGSGSLTTSLIHTIKPAGFVHTFEYHKDRVSAAEYDFKRLRLERYVKVRHHDVVKHGFPLLRRNKGRHDTVNDAIDDYHNVDAIILDIPSPWDVIGSCQRNLRIGTGRIASYSPCIEQTQRTCRALSNYGFKEIYTTEVLTHTYEEQQQSIHIPNFYKQQQLSADSLSSSMQTSSPSNKRPRDMRSMKDEVDENDDKEMNDRVNENVDVNVHDDSERKEDNGNEVGVGSDEDEVHQSDVDGNTAVHRVREIDSNVVKHDDARGTGSVKRKHHKVDVSSSGTIRMFTSRPYHIQRGHTAYLTFATNYDRTQEHQHPLRPQDSILQSSNSCTRSSCILHQSPSIH